MNLQLDKTVNLFELSTDVGTAIDKYLESFFKTNPTESKISNELHLIRLCITGNDKTEKIADNLLLMFISRIDIGTLKNKDLIEYINKVKEFNSENALENNNPHNLLVNYLSHYVRLLNQAESVLNPINNDGKEVSDDSEEWKILYKFMSEGISTDNKPDSFENEAKVESSQITNKLKEVFPGSNSVNISKSPDLLWNTLSRMKYDPSYSQEIFGMFGEFFGPSEIEGKTVFAINLGTETYYFTGDSQQVEHFIDDIEENAIDMFPISFVKEKYNSNRFDITLVSNSNQIIVNGMLLDFVKNFADLATLIESNKDEIFKLVHLDLQNENFKELFEILISVLKAYDENGLKDGFPFTLDSRFQPRASFLFSPIVSSIVGWLLNAKNKNNTAKVLFGQYLEDNTKK